MTIITHMICFLRALFRAIFGKDLPQAKKKEKKTTLYLSKDPLFILARPWLAIISNLCVMTYDSEKLFFKKSEPSRLQIWNISYSFIMNGFINFIDCTIDQSEHYYFRLVFERCNNKNLWRCFMRRIMWLLCV